MANLEHTTDQNSAYKLCASGHLPHDALTAASAALSTLSYLIGTRTEVNFEGDDCYGLSVMLDAIRDDMNKVAEVIENDRRRTTENMTAEYERGFQNGVAHGRDQGADSGTYQGALDAVRAQRVKDAQAEDAVPVPKLTEDVEQGNGAIKSA